MAKDITGQEIVDAQPDGVYVDSVNGVAGTAWPIGTAELPVSNIPDAKIISVARKTNNIFIYDRAGGAQLLSAMSGYRFIGRDRDNDTIQINNQDVSFSFFSKLNVTQQIPVTSRVYMEDCLANYDGDIYGTYHNCMFEGIFTLKSGANSVIDATVFDFVSLNVPGGGLYIHEGRGDLILQNMLGGNIYLYGTAGMTLTIMASCTAGNVNIYGDVKIVNNSGGTVVNDYTNKPKAEIPVNITAIAAGETNFLNLATAGFHYTIDDLVLKCADPGVNTINVKLYKLVNGASTLVDTYAITTASFATYFNLNDLFGQSTLAGDNIKITVQCTGGGPYIVLGSYSARSA